MLHVRRKKRAASSGPKRAVAFAAVVCVILFVAFNNVKNLGELYDAIIQYSYSPLQHQNSNDNETQTTGSTTTGTGTVMDQATERRWDFYKRIYRYNPPSPRPSHEGPSSAECGSAPDFEPFFRQGINFRSRLNEDKQIYHKYFYNATTNYNYIELGAYNGSRESNTRFFDVCLGWNGLLLEGNPVTYRQLLHTRPRAHRMSFAPVCNDTGTNMTFYEVDSAMAGLPGRAKTFRQERGDPTVQVPCGPLGPVLQDVFANNNNNKQNDGKEGLPTIHFFSLDVEGSEPLVLETIDFSKVRILILMIEVINAHCRKKNNCAVRNSVREIMDGHGYARISDWIHQSDVFVHPSLQQEQEQQQQQRL